MSEADGNPEKDQEFNLFYFLFVLIRLEVEIMQC